MARFQNAKLSLIFIALAIGCAIVLGLMISGRLRIDSEWPGLVVGAILLSVVLFIARR